MEQNKKFSIAYHFILTAYSLIPAIGLIIFWSFLIRARNYLGNWPYPYHPDPKSLPFDLHHYIAFVTLMLIPFSIIPWLIIYLPKKFLFPKTKWFSLILHAVPWIITLLYFFTDPGNFIEWFFD